jgi:hypothetical protein
MQEEDEELLRESCAVGNLIAAEFYLRKGISINCQHKISKFTPLHWAYSRKQDGIVDLLKRNGADETLLDANGRVPSECKPIEFQPNYLKNPDLNKLWGVPDSREAAPMPVPIQKRPVEQPVASVNFPKEIVFIPHTDTTEMLQVLVFVSSTAQSNLKGAVFVNPTSTLSHLKEMIIEQLEGIPKIFDIARVYDGLVVPITAKQMEHNAFMHLSHKTDAAKMFKNRADLVIFPKIGNEQTLQS